MQVFGSAGGVHRIGRTSPESRIVNSGLPAPEQASRGCVSGRRAARGQQADPHRGDQRLGPVRGAELLVDPRDVGLGGRLAQVELPPICGGAQPVGQQQQYVVLALGERGRLA